MPAFGPPPPWLIPNDYLTEADIPGENARWDQDPGIGRFAATFNGYQYWGSSEKSFEVGSIHNKDLSTLTLTELRTSLFCHFRALHHAGFDDLKPGDDKGAQQILAEIRDRVRRRALD